MKIDTFTRAYIEAALWSSTAYGSESHRESENPDQFDHSFEHENFDIEDISPVLLASIVEDCTDFQHANEDTLSLAPEWYTAEQAGHDFWLTRNGHGAGFWDRGLGDIGRTLTEAAKVYGSEDWYVDDDGQIAR